MKIKFIIILSLFVFTFSLNAQIFYRTGSDVDIETEPVFGILLAGGATDNDDGMTWLAERANGIGVNEHTAVSVDENGLARVFGHPSYDDYAYFLKTNYEAEVCEDGQPLSWYHASFEGDGYMLSRSWVSNTPLTPDNWLITKQVMLGEDPGTGITNYGSKENAKITLYPNPVKNRINLENRHYLNIQGWEVFSLEGSKIISAQNTFSDNEIIDIGILKPGFYLIKIMFEDYTAITLRFVKGL